jgi:hypothetical protein
VVKPDVLGAMAGDRLIEDLAPRCARSRSGRVAIALGRDPIATNSDTFLTSPAQLRFETAPSRRGEQAALVSFTNMPKLARNAGKELMAPPTRQGAGRSLPANPIGPSL